MRRFRARTLAITVTAICLAIPAVAAVAETTTTLAVRGKGQISRPAELLSIYVGVDSQKVDPAEAMIDNATRMDSVIAALKKLGITDEQYETERVELEPLFKEKPYETPEDWEPKLLGYKVENAIRARTDAVDKAGEFLQAVSEAGADSVYISFALKDEQKYREEAIAAATANAKRDAEALAKAAGLSLVRMRSIVLDDADQARWGATVSSVYSYSSWDAYMASPPPSAPTIKAGHVRVSSTVSIVYEVEETEGN